MEGKDGMPLSTGDVLTASPTVNTSLIDLRDLLDLLRRHPLPMPFNLALFSELQGHQALQEVVQGLCRPAIEATAACGSACTAGCFQQWEDLISLALLSDRPQVHSCPQGFLGFAIPFPGGAGMPDCLLGGGIRNGDLAPAATDGVHADLFPPAPAELAQPAASFEEAHGLAGEIARLLPRLLEQPIQNLGLARATERLAAIREIARSLGAAPASSDAIAMVCEALVVLFDLPRLVLLMRRPGDVYCVHTTLGLAAGGFDLAEGALQERLERGGGTPVPLSGEEVAVLLPGVATRAGHLYPLAEAGDALGVLLILDVDLHLRDQAMIELLLGRLGARLQRLRLEEDQRLERQYSTRMVSMISTLALAVSREELYRNLLEMCAELVEATSGSLMLLDEQSQQLGIAVAKGMSPPLARSMSVALGEGIAGRVARNGTPLLVSDIERDTRVGTPNRPRFRTKSFICLPLKHRERLIGVLNLADKSDGGSFSETDLNLVLSFAGQAVQMSDRAAVLERAEQLEQLTVTDSLTGLYNRRFLETRLEEERSRSQRQNQPFSLIFADLDNFKLYNDICGHLSGDKALRKAALLMRRSAREMDVVARYGGEEFCLILPATSKKESLFVAERLRRAIEAETFPGETNLPLGRLTVSLGIASYPEDGDTIHALIHSADLALYRAKDLGRNRTVLYEASMESDRLARKRIPG